MNVEDLFSGRLFQNFCDSGNSDTTTENFDIIDVFFSEASLV